MPRQHPVQVFDLEQKIARLERKIAQLESHTPSAYTRVDANGYLRVCVGEQADGKFGLRVYNNVGTLVYDYTTTA